MTRNSNTIFLFNVLVFLTTFLTLFYPTFAEDLTMARREYYPSGKLWEEVYYKDGKQEQVIKEYYESGALKSERAFKNGRPDGIVKTYYENGKLMSESQHNNGLLNGLFKTYYKSGILRSEKLYREGKEEGVFKFYFENGNLSSECGFIYGKAEGICKEYFENGNLKSETPYSNGKVNGTVKKYYEDGKLEIEKPYQDSIVVVPSSTSYYDKTGNIIKKVAHVDSATKEASVKILSPSKGAIFHPGETVFIKLSVPDELKNIIIFTWTGESELLNKPPYEFKFTIPNDAATGEGAIIAGGTDEMGDFFGKDETVIYIK